MADRELGLQRRSRRIVAFDDEFGSLEAEWIDLFLFFIGDRLNIYVEQILRSRLFGPKMNQALQLAAGYECALRANRLGRIDRQVQHVAASEQPFGADHVENRARIDLRRHRESDARRNIGFNEARDNVHRRAPRRAVLYSRAVEALDEALRAQGSRLVVRRGNPAAILRALCKETGAGGVVFVGLEPVNFFVTTRFYQLNEWQRGIVLQWGKFRHIVGPGIFWVTPVAQSMASVVDIRVVTRTFTGEQIMTKDNVALGLTIVLRFQIIDPKRAVIDVANYLQTVEQASQAALQNAIGRATLDSILSDRESLDRQLQVTVDSITEPWGVKIVAVDALPAELPYVERGLAPVLFAQPVYLCGSVSVNTIFDHVHLQKDVPAHVQMDLVRVSTDNLGTWARQLKPWGVPDVDPKYPALPN